MADDKRCWTCDQRVEVVERGLTQHIVGLDAEALVTAGRTIEVLTGERDAARADLATARDQIGRYALSLRERDDELAAQGARLAEVETNRVRLRVALIYLRDQVLDEVQPPYSDDGHDVWSSVLREVREALDKQEVGEWAGAPAVARAELAAVVGERDRYRAALESLEWREEVLDDAGTEGYICLFCENYRDEGHKAGCPMAAALASASLQPGEASERERYRAALLQVRVWTSTPKGLTDRKAQLAAIKRIADDALAPPPPATPITTSRLDAVTRWYTFPEPDDDAPPPPEVS